MILDFDQAHRPRIIAAMKGLYPIPLIPDPAWKGDPIMAPLVPEFTDNEWVKEAIIQRMNRDIHRWESHVAARAARNAVICDKPIR
jgi:hypothetical protein